MRSSLQIATPCKPAEGANTPSSQPYISKGVRDEGSSPSFSLTRTRTLSLSAASPLPLPSAALRVSVILDGQTELPAVHGAADPQPHLQVFIRQPQQHLYIAQATTVKSLAA